MFESAAEASLMAARWQQGRLADLGFPGREQAMKAYRPLAAEELPRPAAVIEQGADERSDPPLPAPLAGRVLGRALAGLPDSLRDHVLGDLFGVANSLAVADLLPLAEPETVERCVSKAVRGIDRGLEEAARAQDRTPAMVLQAVPVLDLFRIGATLEPELRPVRTVADLKREEADGADWDWNEIREMIAEADRTIGADGRLK
jgi:hypothetical protein